MSAHVIRVEVYRLKLAPKHDNTNPLMDGSLSGMVADIKELDVKKDHVLVIFPNGRSSEGSSVQVFVSLAGYKPEIDKSTQDRLKELVITEVRKQANGENVLCFFNYLF